MMGALKLADDNLVARVTGREAPLFAQDIATRESTIRERVEGSRILVIGGAGSIGAATIRAIIPFRPHSVHVVDQNENGLAELVRDLRSSAEPLSVPDFRTLPLDFGSQIMHRFLADAAQDAGPYDLVLNFAALKHVRSEKDPYSLLQMLDTNVLKPARLLRWLAGLHPDIDYFCVSTDKAANPTSLMGASKRVMEHLVFSGETVDGWRPRVTSARFANVAFSDGSLLESFLRRLARRQPLAAPENTRRYFISLEEAGQICLLAATCAPADHLLFPRFTAVELRELTAVAEAVLLHHGLRPMQYRDEATARRRVSEDMAAGRYPLLLTPLDTSGEKPYEEFVGEGETSVEVGMTNLLAVPYAPGRRGAVRLFLEQIEALLRDAGRSTTKEQLVTWLQQVVPPLHHVETGLSLDQKM